MASAGRTAKRVAVGLPLALFGVLAFQAAQTMRREYFETPAYDIAAVLQPANGATGAEPVSLVMLGDSTVAGLGAETAQDSLVVQTAQRVADELGRPVDARGLGVSGARTRDVREEQVPLIDADVDVVVIVIGANDVTHLIPPWSMDDETTALLTAAHRRAPEAVVVLGGIPLFGEARAFDEPLRSVVDAYATVVRRQQRRAAAGIEGVTFVDIATQASPRFVGVPDAMSRDGFHPAATGYGFWADALAPAIAAAVAGDR